MLARKLPVDNIRYGNSGANLRETPKSTSWRITKAVSEDQWQKAVARNRVVTFVLLVGTPFLLMKAPQIIVWVMDKI